MPAGPKFPRGVKHPVEQDVHTGWRHVLILQPGFIKYVKRYTNKRERREGKKFIRQEGD